MRHPAAAFAAAFLSVLPYRQHVMLVQFGNQRIDCLRAFGAVEYDFVGRPEGKHAGQRQGQHDEQDDQSCFRAASARPRGSVVEVMGCLSLSSPLIVEGAASRKSLNCHVQARTDWLQRMHESAHLTRSPSIYCLRPKSPSTPSGGGLRIEWLQRERVDKIRVLLISRKR